MHFHNTRGTGLANALAALDAGVRRLDASVGGTGGCPFAPRATGNIATEDLAYLLAGQGLRTGIDIEAVVEVNAGSPATSARSCRRWSRGQACRTGSRRAEHGLAERTRARRSGRSRRDRPPAWDQSSERWVGMPARRERTSASRYRR